MRLLSLSKYTGPEHRIGSLSVVEGSWYTLLYAGLLRNPGLLSLSKHPGTHCYMQDCLEIQDC